METKIGRLFKIENNGKSNIYRSTVWHESGMPKYARVFFEV